MSLVALFNQCQAGGQDGIVFSGIQSCEPELRAYLRNHSGLCDPAKEAAATLRERFPDAKIALRLDADPDDSKRSVVFHLRVNRLSLEDRLAFYNLAGEINPSGQHPFVFVIDRD